MRLRYYGSLRDLTKCRSEEVKVSTIKGIFAHIREAHGQQAYDLARSSSILVNGINWIFKRGKLQRDDEIHIFPPIAGG